VSSISTYAGSAGSGQASGGTVAWTNTANYTGAPDAVYASTSTGLIGSGTETDSLDAYNFAPSVPGGSTINGVQYVGTYHHNSLSTRAVSCQAVQLGVGGSDSSGPTTTNANGTALTTTDATYTWGSSTDLWGLTTAQFTVANVNSAVEGTGPTFSVFFEGGGGTSGTTVFADSVQQTVWFTASGASPVWTGQIVTGCAVGMASTW
jgi:hypothetical protein